MTGTENKNKGALTNAEIQSRYQKKMKNKGAIRIHGYIQDPELIAIFHQYQESIGTNKVKPTIEKIIESFLRQL